MNMLGLLLNSSLIELSLTSSRAKLFGNYLCVLITLFTSSFHSYYQACFMHNTYDCLLTSLCTFLPGVSSQGLCLHYLMAVLPAFHLDLLISGRYLAVIVTTCSTLFGEEAFT